MEVLAIFHIAQEGWNYSWFTGIVICHVPMSRLSLLLYYLERSECRHLVSLHTVFILGGCYLAF